MQPCRPRILAAAGLVTFLLVLLGTMGAAGAASSAELCHQPCHGEVGHHAGGTESSPVPCLHVDPCGGHGGAGIAGPLALLGSTGALVPPLKGQRRPRVSVLTGGLSLRATGIEHPPRLAD